MLLTVPSAPALAGAAVLLVMLVRVLYFMVMPDDLLVGVVGDDAFYYMQVARHRVSDGFWTFDGSATATGFHLLYGYLLVAIYAIAGDIGWRQLYVLIGLLASTSIAASAYFTSRVVEGLFDRNVILVALVPFVSASALVQSTTMMESWMVLLFSAVTLFRVKSPTTPDLYSATGLIALGVLGSLARADYGMLPGILFCVFLVRHFYFERDDRLARITLILTGAVIGTAIVLLHCYAVSGQFFQASARMKLHWSEVVGHDIFAPIRLVATIVFPYFPSLSSVLKHVFVLVSATLLVLALLLQLRALRMERGAASSLSVFVFVGCVLAMSGYVVFYRFNSVSLQTWYSSNFIVPLAISLAGLFHFTLRKKAFIGAALALGLYAITGATNIFAVTWPWQAGMMHAGLYLKSEGSQTAYAAWNAGIISYFSEKPVINIDGLINDEVLPFARSNRLLDYIKLRNIGYVVDYEEMIRYPDLRLRGGYEEARTDKCLRPLQPVDGEMDQFWGESRLKIIEVVPGCL